MAGAGLDGARVLLGVSGGVAAYKAAGLARALVKAGAQVQAVLTTSAAEFVGPATFAALTGKPAHSGVFSDVHRIVHVRMAREADVAVIAPATANVIAKLALGIADDLLTSTALCLTAPLVVAPAMHTEMWEHPATQTNVAVLRERGVTIVGPDEGELAGGDVGPGRLADAGALLAAIAGALAGAAPDDADLRGEGDRLRSTAGGDLFGRRVVVTAGGTREPIDPVRYLGNRSSGKMGYAIAAEAARRGAIVDLVSAPTHLETPPGVTLHQVETAEQMRAAVLPLADKADVVVKAAAVADFRPAAYAVQKLKKEDGPPQLVLERNPDILAELGAEPHGRILVGFAAETELEEERGRDKLRRKGLDLIVVNRVDASDAGFNVDTNRALVLGADGSRTDVGLVPKAEMATLIWDRIHDLLTSTKDASP